MLKYIIELREHDRIGDEALNSALRVLKLPDVEEMSPKQEEMEEELYDEPWCISGWIRKFFFGSTSHTHPGYIARISLTCTCTVDHSHVHKWLVVRNVRCYADRSWELRFLCEQLPHSVSNSG